ncbi:MAG: PadR family transcriptional regulator [Nocardioidaceae bacterium]|nr:PadR family transcriptional regulator [Nocardioidaceae bacterium]
MALEHAILVSLAEQPASGYDLTRRFDRSIGLFWRATHQQVYRTLARMEADGLVASTAVEQQGRPDKKVFAIADAGRDALTSWVDAPSAVEQTRSDLAVRVRGLHHGDASAVLDDVRRHLVAHRERLEGFRRSSERHYPDPGALAPEDVGPYLVLRGGIRTEEAVVAWCEEIIATSAVTPADPAGRRPAPPAR